MRCDFESDDLCGWVQDTTTDEFDWTWQNYGTPSSHLSTGPSFDHTLGQGKSGQYIFIHSLIFFWVHLPIVVTIDLFFL